MPPTVLAGRDEILEDVDDAIATAALDHRMPTPMVLVGARGVGKTVLLEEIAQRAGVTYGWPWLRVEMTDATPFTPTLISGAAPIRSLITQARPRDRFKAMGHGIGRRIHEQPNIPNYDAPGFDQPLTEGLVVTIEPIIAAGRSAVRQAGDGWTITTRDGSYTAHSEHTMVVTAGAPLILSA